MYCTLHVETEATCRLRLENIQADRDKQSSTVADTAHGIGLYDLLLLLASVSIIMQLRLDRQITAPVIISGECSNWQNLHLQDVRLSEEPLWAEQPPQAG